MEMYKMELELRNLRKQLMNKEESNQVILWVYSELVWNTNPTDKAGTSNSNDSWDQFYSRDGQSFLSDLCRVWLLQECNLSNIVLFLYIPFKSSSLD